MSLAVLEANINLQGFELYSTAKQLKTCHVIEVNSTYFQDLRQEKQLQNVTSEAK